MAAAPAVTAHLNNAATVPVIASIGASLATRLNLSPEPFPMAVYPRPGAPRPLIIPVVGTLPIVLVWLLSR